MKNLLLMLLFFTGSLFYSQCSVNAGPNTTICGTSTTLQGTLGTGTSGSPTWTLVSKPSGAPDPVITGVNTLTPNITGMTSPGNYVFQITQPCASGPPVTSQVTITAPGAVTTFTAGPDITNVNATVGTVTLNGVVPAGYTAEWSAYNIYRWERSTIKDSQNSQFSSTSTASTTFSLVNKVNHDIDPAYVVTLKITSTLNPNCFYEDTAIVRFIPNPQIAPTLSTTRCVASGGDHYIDLINGTPIFMTGTPGSSGNAAFGTTVIVNPITQPAGANISFWRLYDNRIFFNGITATGTYTFTVTVTNAAGTYTTPTITYIYNGIQSSPVSFLVASDPEQIMTYASTGSGGEVQCGLAGTSTPVVFRFTINPSDPTSVTTNVVGSGIAPPGGVATAVVTGAGTATRTATVSAPAGGWRVGTYRFTVSTGNVTCPAITQFYYIHVSDSGRPNVTVNDLTICYPGSGAVSATIPLPAIYKGVVNSSYFQDFDAQYDFTVISKPAGSGTPSIPARNLRLITSTSTQIGNLTMPGEYVFRIKANPVNSNIGTFLDKEYACSATSREDTFSIFVTDALNSNAGSDQIVVGNTATLNGNNPGVSTGTWTLVSKPAGAPDPVIASPTAFNSNVTGLITAGSYTFRWTIATGTCINADDVVLSVSEAAPGGVVGPNFWVKSDDAGTIATAWKDNSSNVNNIPNVGGIALSPADRNHNFHPYTTGYTSAKYFHNNTSVMNPLGNVEYPNINTSIFSAIRPTTTAGGRIIGIDNDAAFAAEPGVSITAAGRPRQYEFFNTTTSSDFSTTFNIGQSNIFSALANNTVANGGTSAIAGGEKRLGLNGVYESFSGFATANKFQIYGTNLRLGYATWDVSGAFPGDIMEVLWYNRTLTANEQSRVNSYLAVKNGVTLAENYLSTTSSVVWDRISNTGYNNNIFGIARDNITILHQKQSGSINDGQKLVISTTGFADSNAANITGLANDLQFLMTGDNGLKQSLSIPLSYTTGSNGATNYRFESIWKVQNTNTVGTVTVAWPKGVKNLYLVQSSDAIFDGTDTFTPMTTEITVNGVVYNTANVTLGNAQFFTFAGLGNAPGGVATGLSYWYRADKNVANTGATTDVTGWTDMWNGTTVAQLGTNALPKFVLGTSTYFNFNPGINFTAGTQTLGNNTVRTLTSLDYDVFTFTKEGLASGGANPRVFSTGRDNTTTGSTNWDGFGIWPATTNLERRPFGGVTQFPTVAPAFSAAIPSIMYFRNTNTTTNKGLNGAALSATTNFTAVNAQFGGHIFGDTRFSSNASDNAGFTGHIGETIVYGAGSLTDVERRRVDSYLAIKYGITLGLAATDHYLDTDGNMVWNGASNIAYNSNIFGVSRDDIEAFEQKVSKSVNAGTILTVATINDFVNPNENAARTGFANDKTYFLLGDNNVVATPVVDITVAGNAWKRIQRVWLSQRKNTPGALYFEADLSTYGVNFAASSTVWMLVADDAAFTTNVQSVAGTFTNGKWVFSKNFDADNVQRYITFAGLAPSYCTTGCNNNTFLNTSNPNTIEYDNIVSTFHSTGMRDASTGALKVFGERMANNGSTSLLIPTEVNSTNYPALTGNILKFAGGSASINIVQSVVLTTTGLFAWGQQGLVIPTGITTSTTFQKIAVGTYGVAGAPKADGLPDGVAPEDVKMLFANLRTLALTTCSGEAWVLSGNGIAYGNGTTANDALWHRVNINQNVVALRGTMEMLMALTATGEVYTWGTNTSLGDGTEPVNRPLATRMTLPAGVTPKMIGISGITYYLLGTNGNVYSLGANSNGELGNFSTNNSETWVQVQKSATAGDYLTNVVYISPNEHEASGTNGSINVLTTNGRLWAWGHNSNAMLGGGSGNTMNPTEMPGSIPAANPYNIGKLNWTDKVTAVETGGHTSIIFKENSKKYGYVGHRINGSMGDGTSTDAVESTYNFQDTAEINLCGAPTEQGVCYKPGIAGTGLETKVGITSLSRAGATDTDNWPMTRKGGWIALESQTKGFVPNRVAFDTSGNPIGIPAANFVEGMMVFDTVNKCMKMYTSANGGISFAWFCITTQTCTDIDLGSSKH